MAVVRARFLVMAITLGGGCVDVHGTGDVGSEPPVLSPGSTQNDTSATPPTQEPTPPATAPTSPDAGAGADDDGTNTKTAPCANPADVLDGDKPGAVIRVAGTATPAPITPPCFRVRKGQPVRFAGALLAHPMVLALPDGDAALEQLSKDKTAGEMKLEKVGVFPFRCSVHPGVEHGHVLVVDAPKP